MKIKLKGILSYPWLNAVDTKFNTSGEFKTGIIGGVVLNQASIDAIDAELERYINSDDAKSKNNKKKPKLHGDALPYEVSEDGDTVTFRTKNKCYPTKDRTSTWSRPVAFVSSTNEALGSVKVDEGDIVASDTVPAIGGGTKAILNCELTGWCVSGKAGVSLRPSAVKIITLVEGGGGDDGTDAFDDDEDDFDAPQAQQSKSADETDEDDF
jgi:hypothetical protein